MTQAERQKEWENRIAQYRDSGKSVRQWCAANNVSEERLWYWLRKYKTNGQIGSNKDAPLNQSNQWLPVELSEHSPMEQNNSLTIRVGKAQIEVKGGFDPGLLSQVVRALVTLC
ncbi:MAG: IS66 family insertion sequence hypothetical protein [Candidatus Aquicultor secundus]|nr:MAG: IS66 family insertion sequence hypothetical protein [Candidatus Aquicultor secundus]